MPQHNEGFCTKLLLESCAANDLWCINKEICTEGCGDNPLRCQMFCEHLLTFIVNTIQMTELDRVSVNLVHPDDPEKSGVSAVAIIAESHIGLHTWSETNALRLVIDSCKEYNVENLVNSLCFVVKPAIVKAWVEDNKQKVSLGVLDRKWIFLRKNHQ